jgi:hypothetical protein
MARDNPRSISSCRTLGRPSGSSSVGRAAAFQAACREFEPRLPLHFPWNLWARLRVPAAMIARASLRLGLLAIALVASACSSASSVASPASSAAASAAPSAAASAAASIDPSGALATVELRGGECAAPATCDTVITLDASGRIHLNAKPPNDLGTASASELKALQDAIDSTDFDALRNPAFTGTCPTAYDGQELLFSFTTAHGVERLESCKSALDYNAPVFKALTAALGTNSPMKVSN